ncbi:MAG: phosphoribosylformylglycinamidine synthase subunit PurL [Thermoprotei archaeon]|jgi:phosphoribosylformylglycinamidine synthase
MRYRKLPFPFEVYEIEITNASKNELLEISNQLRLNLNLKEMLAIQEYFINNKRNPTDIELQTIGQLWSEHCRHKVFKGLIVDSNGKILASNMLQSFIAKVTEELNMPWVISFLKDNAGIIDFVNEYAMAVKVETHNHPSAIDPFCGAATGVGGVIRDILGVWAKPVALIDVICFGSIDYPYEKLPQGLKHPRYLFRGVTSGISYYGNNMGIPTVAGAVCFDDCYVGNVVVYVGCIGLVPKSKYIWKVKPGDLVVVIGNRTGRDGIHGATFASADLQENAEYVFRSAIQIPDPIEEEKLKRFILRIRDKEIASGITDLGGGGLAVASVEMANRMNGGVIINLDKLHLRESNMAPWEIWISESQERMLLAVPKENIRDFLKIIDDEELKASIIGKFTADHKLKVYFRGNLLANLDIKFLLEPPKVIRKASWNQPKFFEPVFPEPENLENELLKVLSSPNVASRESIIRIYDHEVQGNTALKPLHGKYGGPNDAAILKPLDDSWAGVVISTGIKPWYSKIDPYWMAASSLEEALRNNTAVGGRRIAILDNFTWGNPEKPDRMGELYRAVKACYDFAKIFETPFISGKDSLYNESSLGPVLSTLLITAVGIIPDIRKSVSINLKKHGNPIYMLGITRPELGASEYYRLRGFLGNTVPKVYASESKLSMKCLIEAIDSGYVLASHDLSEGGLGVAIAEMVLSSDFGAEIWLNNVAKENINRNDYLLFSESNGRFLLEIKKESEDAFINLASSVGCAYSKVGIVTNQNRLLIYGLHGDILVDLSSLELRNAWKGGLKW